MNSDQITTTERLTELETVIARGFIAGDGLMWYNISCLGERVTGRFAFQAPSLSQYFIVGKTPSMCGLTSRRSPRQRRQAHGGRFVMNPKTLKITIRKCGLCDFPMSEFHHFYPGIRDGEKTGSKSGVYLCPNHHLMANILQVQIERFCRERSCGASELRPDEFDHLHKFFDEPFKSKILYFIMGFDEGEHEAVAHMEREAIENMPACNRVYYDRSINY